ncbi:MAG: autotransporter outer membrane beta-barrel domain-containing protein, partial [Desulfovibrio sp.]|nr:autotransporter outer membrane beta-barrel domain-containing protein [Desulfovibrio sp.]
LDNVNSKVNTLKLNGGHTALINSSLEVVNLNLGGGLLYLDPSYFAAEKLSKATISSQMVVGSGSVSILESAGLDLGDVNAAIVDTFDVKSAHDLGEGQAALAIGKSITLGQGGVIYVDPTASVDGTAVTSASTFGNVSDLSTTTQTAFFGPGSLLIVDARSVDGAVISAQEGNTDHTARIESAAKLVVLNPVKGSFALLKGFAGGITASGWLEIKNADRMLSLSKELENSDTTLTLNATVNDPKEALPGLDSDLSPAVRKTWDKGLNDVDSSMGGVRFLSRAANDNYMADATSASRTVESAARIALIGGVPTMTYAANSAAVDAITARLGKASPTNLYTMNADGSIGRGASAGSDYATHGFGLWITPLFKSMNGFGLEAGNNEMDVSGRLGGVALGADYTFENNLRFGLTFNIGGGFNTGSGDYSETKNNFNFWGIGAYAGWAPNAFSLTADVNYTSIFNKLRQDLPGSLGMGEELKTSMFSSALSAGLRGEYLIQSAIDITPHVGVRHTWLHVDEYNVKASGTKILKGDAISQNIWSFPLGVTFSKNLEFDNGWHMTPQLDLQLTPHAGDIKAKAQTRFTGVPKKSELDTQVFDYLTYGGQVGVEFGKNNFTVGVNYNLQICAHSSSHGVFGTLRYEF